MTWHRVLVSGATSAIGQAVVRRLAGQVRELVLLGRDTQEIDRVIADLRVRCSTYAVARAFEATNTASHQRLIRDVTRSQKLDGAILCHGYIVDQSKAEESWHQAERMISVNYSSYIALCSALAHHFREQGRGFLCAVSSVAGDRGRQSNFIYGSAKGGLSIYLQGLRNAMHEHNVHVLTVKPGFVDTGMTWGLVNPNSPLVASPEKIANDIVRAVNNHKDTVYTPWFWRWIMFLLRSIPEVFFKRLKL